MHLKCGLMNIINFLKCINHICIWQYHNGIVGWLIKIESVQFLNKS